LFEINDGSFAEDMKAAHTAAKDILRKRGALEDAAHSETAAGTHIDSLNITPS